MFPPLTTAHTFLFSIFTLSCIIAATLTAPAPSTISLCFSSKKRIAFAVSLSLTSTISSTYSKIISSNFGLTSRTAIPSAIVLTLDESIGILASKLSFIPFAPLATTPVIFIFGFILFAAIAIPEINPPPPIGTIIWSISSIFSKISKAIVP